jgi:multidrug efflux system membrane fusion protein
MRLSLRVLEKLFGRNSNIRRDLRPRRLRPAVLAAALGAPLMLAACGGSHEAQGGARPPVPVTTADVVRQTMPVTLRAIGNVEAIETVAVKARIGGALLRIGFQEGESVRRGDILFVIDPRPYEAALAQAEAVLARDQALLSKAKADIARYVDLVKEDYVTKEQYDQITADAAALEAAVAADTAAAQTARLNLEYCTISAPVSGRTGNLGVRVGNLVKANDDAAMVTINQMSPIYVSFSIPAQHLPAVLAPRSGDVAVLAATPDDPGNPERGELSFVDNAVDTTTSTILLKGTFANRNQRLWPGQFVDVTLVLGEEPDRVVCPSAAVQTGQQGQFVFVVKGDSTVEMRSVEVDRMDERDAVIASGLSAGETVVTDGQLRLVPGVAVEVESPERPDGATP